MMTTRILPAAALVLGSIAVASVPASAAPLMVGAAAQPAPVTTQQVQWRHHHHGWHGGGGWHGHRGGGYYRHGGYGWGPAIGGLAAGAIIGGAIANSQAQAGAVDADAYCSQRFRSYDPASGTYLGYDGRRHACP
ncbi:BA14K family protein [Rhodopseudomonas palustris]|uniref:BA14K family protein n=1 Tax=Rhodopseudomonas palustris TaxID=1076 RepID=UPI000E5AA291|nr:BA14K family protein [Rhodopseudomonas palustris]QLH73507.1 BA14K family protein [Rhodopseudomonas palustris]RIA02915.1 BA14K family protein [Rhodopseudomonas palustris]